MMALFRYEAVDKTGKVVRGVMNAADEQEVVRNLSARGYAPRGVHSASSSAPTPAPAVTSSGAYAGAQVAATARPVGPASLVSVKSVVPASRLAIFFRQLATMVRAGMPLTQAFTEASQHVRSRQLAKVIPDIQSALNAGRTLSSAMAAYPHLFPVHAVAVVWCGELAGKLEAALDDVASDFELEASETRYGRIGWGLTKITLVVLILAIPLFNMGTLLAPIINETAVDSREFVSQYVSEVLSTVLKIGLPIVLALMGSWIAWGYVKRVQSVRRVLDGIVLRMPPWGNLHRWRSLARFLKWMELAYSAGVNPSTAWDAASLTPRNSEIAERLRASRESASMHVGVGEMARISGALPEDEVALIAGAEKSGDAPATLARLAEVYADKAASQKTVGRTLSFSLLIACQLAVGGLVMIVMASTYARALYKLMGF